MEATNEPGFDASHTITRLLERVQSGDGDAWGPLLTEVHALLRSLAHRSMQGERADHLLQTTALVNEAWMRLANTAQPSYAARHEFLRAAGSAMRRVLVDESRRRRALKRGEGAARMSISQIVEVQAEASADADLDLEALDRALEAFEREPRHAQKCRVVEMRYFVGLTLEQTADALGVSLATVKRDWEFARAWLEREIARASGVRDER